MTGPRLFTLILLAGASAAAAQQTTAPQPPVFRSGVELVRVDVRVTDDDGRPIGDLQPGEVRIAEDGSDRPILLFQHVAAPRVTYAEAAARAAAGQVSSNQASPRGHVYVLVFDEAHILPGHEQRARLAAERFLRTRVEPGDRVALYALPGPGPQIEFTADVGRVLRALRSVRGSGEDIANTALGSLRAYDAYEIARGNQVVLEREADRASAERLASDTRGAALNRPNPVNDPEDPASLRRTMAENARSYVERADGDSRRFLLSLADVVGTLRAVDGRKAVILFSEGFQIDNVTHELEQVSAAAAESYSVVHAMDLNDHGVAVDAEDARGGEQAAEIRDRLQSIGSLAADTGGTLVPNAAAQMDRALARIAETTEDYYLIGFTPAAGGDRSRYRRLRVTVARRGAHVNARAGYAMHAVAAGEDPRRAMDAALRAPFSKQDLKIEYTTYVLRGTARDTQRVVLSLAAELPVASATGSVADVAYVVRSADTGRVAASGGDHIALPQTPTDARGGTGIGSYRVQFELVPGAYVMRALVREPGGLMGSADRRFQVRALDRPDVTASDLVMGATGVAGIPVRAAAYPSEVLTGVFELYARSEAQLAKLSVTVDLVPAGGGPAVASSRAEIDPPKVAARGASRGVRVEVPLDGVAPGEYLARATVRENRDTITELLRDVTVHAGSRPAAAVLAFDPADVVRGEVIRTYVDVIRREPRDAAADAVLRGVDSFMRRDYAAAIAAFQSAQAAGRNDAPLAFALGWAHAAAGDSPAAITAWRNAARRDPALVPAYLALADIYIQLGHPELARQVVDSGLAAVPDSRELRERGSRFQVPGSRF